MKHINKHIIPADYLLTRNGYLDLEGIRDRLQLMGCLAGSPAIGDPQAALLVRRMLLGGFFLDISEQLSRVLEAVEYYAEHVDDVPAH